MYGEEYAATDYDHDRYEKVLQVSEDLHELWKDESQSVLYIPKKQVEQWSTRLGTIAKQGLQYSDDSYDIERYSVILSVADEIRDQIRSYSLDLSEIPEPESTSSDVCFVKDRETLPKLLEMIDKAESRVLIASPWIWGIRELEEKLTEVREKKNVIVKILTRKEENDAYHGETIRGFHKRQFSIETADNLHAKIVIVDDKELYIGSANLVAPSMNKNLEAGICTNDSRTVSQALVYFEDAFSQAFAARFAKQND